MLGALEAAAQRRVIRSRSHRSAARLRRRLRRSGRGDRRGNRRAPRPPAEAPARGAIVMPTRGDRCSVRWRATTPARRAVAQIGRAPVSKTGGWGFESLLPCSLLFRAEDCCVNRQTKRLLQRQGQIDEEGAPAPGRRPPPTRNGGQPTPDRPGLAREDSSSSRVRFATSSLRLPGRTAQRLSSTPSSCS